MSKNREAHLSKKDARRAIKEHRSAGDVNQWASGVLKEAARQHKLTTRLARVVLRGGRIPLVDKLKMAEYALLVDPIGDSVGSFIASPGAAYLKAEVWNMSTFCNAITTRISRGIFDYFQDRPEEVQLVRRLLDERVKHLPEGHAAKISPLSHVIKEASNNSVSTMYTSAIANALTARRALGPNVPKERIAQITRQSTQLPLSRPLVHLFDLRNITDSVNKYNFAIMNGGEPTSRLLKFDPVTDRVVLESPVSGWSGPNTAEERLEKVADPEIGCPITFSPGLVKQYYETIVDLIDVCGIWPPEITGVRPEISLSDLGPM